MILKRVLQIVEKTSLKLWKKKTQEKRQAALIFDPEKNLKTYSKAF